MLSKKPNLWLFLQGFSFFCLSESTIKHMVFQHWWTKTNKTNGFSPTRHLHQTLNLDTYMRHLLPLIRHFMRTKMNAAMSLLENKTPLLGFFAGIIFKKVAFWRSYVFLDLMGRCASTNDPRSFDYQLYTTFRRGVKMVHTVFEMVFGPKRTSTIWRYDVMIIWYDDTMIVCYRDIMILRIS